LIDLTGPTTEIFKEPCFVEDPSAFALAHQQLYDMEAREHRIVQSMIISAFEKAE
jgi:hypothetical protein